MLPFAWWNSADEGALGDQSFSVSETIYILDRAALDQISRVVDKDARELLAISEAVSLARRIPVSETVQILDRATLTQISRVVDKDARELLLVTEAVALTKAFSVAETIQILDRAALTKVPRNIDKDARELVAVSEDVTISKVPVISSCEINPSLDEDHPNERVRCRFNTGVNCESVWVDREVDSGGWTGHQQVNTSPSTSGYVANWYNGADGETVRFRIRPFSADGQSGTEGSPCTTSSVEIGLV